MGIEIKKARCVIIGSAPVDEAERRFIGTQVSPEDFLVCADGGYETARRLGLKPGLLIGDLDSCTDCLPQGIGNSGFSERGRSGGVHTDEV